MLLKTYKKCVSLLSSVMMSLGICERENPIILQYKIEKKFNIYARYSDTVISYCSFQTDEIPDTEHDFKRYVEFLDGKDVSDQPPWASAVDVNISRCEAPPFQSPPFRIECSNIASFDALTDLQKSCDKAVGDPFVLASGLVIGASVCAFLYVLHRFDRRRNDYAEIDANLPEDPPHENSEEVIVPVGSPSVSRLR